MTVLIAGDSWGRGEWNNLECVHSGIEQYFKDDSIDVRKISVGGSSNLDTCHRINAFFDRFDKNEISSIIVFQTEYTRDYKYYKAAAEIGIDDLKDLTITTIQSIWVERFYHSLSSISQLLDIPIWIVGGASDTVRFDNMENDYPGCNILCQSFTNLLVNGNDLIDHPVYSWYTSIAVEFIEFAKKHTVDLNNILRVINDGLNREVLLRTTPEWFFPDGVHPNRHGHKILYDFIKRKNIILT